jgi:hypothetical protein
VQAGRYADACPKFEESFRLDRQIGTQLNLANCFEQLGRIASAWALFTEVLETAKEAEDRAFAEAAVARLKPRLPRIEIAASKLPGVEVKLDGSVIAAGLPRVVDPGPHKLEFSATGRVTRLLDIVAVEGQLLPVEVPALDAVPESAAAPASPAAPVEVTLSQKDEPATPPAAPTGPTPRWIAIELRATAGLYSAPADFSTEPTPSFNAGATAGVGILEPSACNCKVAVVGIGSASLVLAASSFQQYFAGAGILVASSSSGASLRFGGGVSILTGAERSLLGAGFDTGVVIPVANRVGVAFDLNMTFSEPYMDVNEMFSTLRIGLGAVWTK